MGILRHGRDRKIVCVCVGGGVLQEWMGKLRQSLADGGTGSIAEGEWSGQFPSLPVRTMPGNT